MAQWWHKCLTDGRIIGAEFEGWPTTVDCEPSCGCKRLAFMHEDLKWATKERRHHRLWIHGVYIIWKMGKWAVRTIKPGGRFLTHLSCFSSTETVYCDNRCRSRIDR